MTFAVSKVLGTGVQWPIEQRIVRLYESAAGMADYIGEPVNIKLHSEQAAQLAKEYNAKDEEMILAALLHDLGHVVGMDAGESAEGMGGCGIPRHEHVGADFLKICGFSDRICRLVRSHVSAKRYFVWKDPNYKLSEASKTTLMY